MMNQSKTQLMDDITSHAKKAVSGEIKNKLNQLSHEHEIKESAQATFVATTEVKKIISLFSQQFTADDIKILGLPPFLYQPGKWYLPWKKNSYIIDLEPSKLLADVKITRPDITNATLRSWRELKTYLSDKLQRRNDNSIFAKPYKTLLAKLIHKYIERIELLTDRILQHQFYTKLLEILDLIWNDDSLVSPDLREDQKHTHIAHFVHVEMELCELRICDLAFEETPHALEQWIDEIDKDLASLHLCGSRLFHLLVQGKPIPDNLEQQLQKIGHTYHRLLLGEQQNKKNQSSEKLCLHISKEKNNTLMKISKQAQKKLQGQVPDILENRLSLAYLHKLTLKEALFLDFNGKLTADQCLYLALYEPNALLLSASQKTDLFGSKAFLQLYQTDTDINGFQWLRRDIQQINDRLFPTLSILTAYDGQESDPEFQYHLNQLKIQIKMLQQSQLNMTNLGIFPELRTSMSYDKEILPIYCQYLALLQQQLYSLVLLRALLSQYKSLLPTLGEVIGALVFRSDLMVIGKEISQSIMLVQNCLLELIPLQGRGYLIVLDEKDHPVKIKKSSLLNVINSVSKPSTSLISWRKQAPDRRKALHDLKLLSNNCLERIGQLPTKISSHRIEHLHKTVNRQFFLARTMLSVGLNEHTLQEHKTELKSSEKVMSKWLKNVESGIKEIKYNELSTTVTEDPQHLTKVSCTSTKIHAPFLSSTNSKPKSSSATLISRKIFSPFEMLTRFFEEVILTGLECLLKSENKEVNWHNLFQSKQETFFTYWQSFRNAYDDQQWVGEIYYNYGFLFSPLPSCHKPKYFIWWHRHKIQDRTLLFNTLCFITLTKYLNENSLLINENCKNSWENLRMLHSKHHQQAYNERWSWLDGFQRNLKQKYWSILQQLSTITLPETTNISTLPGVEPTISICAGETKDIMPCTNQLFLVSSQQDNNGNRKHLLNLNNPSEWKQYETRFRQSDISHKIMMCLLFFQISLKNLTNGTLSFRNPLQEQLCAQVINLFWQVFQIELLHHWLSTPIKQLDQIFIEKKFRPEVKERFFKSWANTINQHKISSEPEQNNYLSISTSI